MKVKTELKLEIREMEQKWTARLVVFIVTGVTMLALIKCSQTPRPAKAASGAQ